MTDLEILADDMVSVTSEVEPSIASTLSSTLSGLLSMPKTMGYLAYDFLDTDNRTQRDNDKTRLMYLIQRGYVNRESLQKIISTIIKKYLSKLNDQQRRQLYKNMIGEQIGKIASNAIVLGKVNAALISRFIPRLLFSMSFSTVLTIGAEQSKTVYASRRLLNENPSIYWELRSSGDLDLLYFLVEEYTKPFEKAAQLKDKNESSFNELLELYLIRLAKHHEQ